MAGGHASTRRSRPLIVPLVSVIIPTFHRPALVGRAVRSVLAQSAGDLEVIVVVDSRDAETVQALGAIADPRLVVHVPDRHLGNADARNAGVALARAPWIAFLDDDDDWFPQKLERQLPLALAATRGTHPIISCRVLVRATGGTMVWPRRTPDPGEDLSEYFFCRRTPFTGEGMVTTTSILTTRELMTKVPFASGLTRHEDPDWVLRAVRHPGAFLSFVPDEEPLLTWYMEHNRPRISTRPDWKASRDWAHENRELFSERGYAAFMLHVASSAAASQHEWRAFGSLLRYASRYGKPRPLDVASHVANFTLPASALRRVAGWYGRLMSGRTAGEA